MGRIFTEYKSNLGLLKVEPRVQIRGSSMQLNTMLKVEPGAKAVACPPGAWTVLTGWNTTDGRLMAALATCLVRSRY